MTKQVKIVLVGIGGYAGSYVSALLKDRDNPNWTLEGVVDPLAQRSSHYGELQQLGLPFYENLEDFYAAHEADLAIVSSPIQYHCPQACQAMEHGSHVLCEKPACAVIQDAERMSRVSAETGRFCAIGYQWSYSPQILSLKADILSGRYGSPKRLRSLTLWPRTDAYYHRNTWAGGLKSAGGDWILDSPVNNATAHYLHNMLFVLGDSMSTAARPARLQAELYRANDITNYDTACLRVITVSGAEILFYTTHAVSTQRGPEFIYEFSHGTVSYNCRTGLMTGVDGEGAQTSYGTPFQGVGAKLSAAIRGAQGDRSAIVCDVNTAKMQTICMNAAQESVGDLVDFPSRDVYLMGVPGASTRVMTQLAEDMADAYASARLLGEAHPRPWTRLGRVVELSDYHFFPSF